jgi:hypothetical protein
VAHFTKLNQENIVITVNVVHNNELLVDGVEDEQKGIDFLNNLFKTNDTWKQTSYNTHGGVHKLGGTPLRKNYAGIGFTYDEARDAFIAPQPYPSFTLNEDTCQWEAPVALPDDGKDYKWNEETLSWVEVVLTNP